MTLIERAEAARTRKEACDVFLDAGAHWLETGQPYHADFDRHIAQALRSKSDDRAKGYLLLAAMAAVPEGWNIDLRKKGRSWHCGIWHGAQNFYRYGDIAACALLAAIIRANEALRAGGEG